MLKKVKGLKITLEIEPTVIEVFADWLHDDKTSPEIILEEVFDSFTLNKKVSEALKDKTKIKSVTPEYTDPLGLLEKYSIPGDREIYLSYLESGRPAFVGPVLVEDVSLYPTDEGDFLELDLKYVPDGSSEHLYALASSIKVISREQFLKEYLGQIIKSEKITDDELRQALFQD